MTPERAPRWVRRPQERPHELLSAALGVFATHGYRATRLEEVAEVAGVTKGSIYYYFANKEELLTQALLSRIGELASGIESEARRPGVPATNRLQAVLQAAWSRWRSPDAARVYRLVMGEVRTEVPSVFQEAMRAGPLRLSEIVARVIEDGQSSGEFSSKFQPQAAARFIVSGLMHQALMMTEMTDGVPDAAPPEEFFAEAVEVLLRGILTIRGAPVTPPRSV